ncbi:MAG: aspartate-semialdehyde dehydrogenase [Pygmaiobacter massiliensis]|nr:aspartate-semialdehyde dehydrogenase [Pygmaiobacter massiliensis]
MKEYRIAVVGATGMVGRTFLKVLEEYQLPVSEYVLFASKKSAGSKLTLCGREYTVQELTEHSFDDGFDIALFSAGGSVSEKFAPIAASKGCVVVDNSSQWRMDPEVPLVVPEVNPEDIKKHKGIIANPNCSTIQAMLPLRVLQKKYGIRRIVYSTYQAVSGAGVKGWNDLVNGAKAYVEGTDCKLEKFPYPIFSNCLPHIDVFMEDGYTKEEHKMINETHKILGDDSIRITATTVRVPVLNCHSESINVELEKDYDLDTLRQELAQMEGLVVLDDPAHDAYPLASIADGHDEVYVGRLRRDNSVENGLNMWVVADNIRKGAASNAVQIARYMIQHDMI